MNRPGRKRSTWCARMSGICPGLLSVGLMLLLQACAAVGPDYQPPGIETPDAWTEKVVEQLGGAPQSTLQSWWTVFDDPVLDDLIEQCRAENLDLKVAVSRVREARAMLALAGGAKLPVVDAGATASRNKESDDGPLQQVAPPGGFKGQNLFQVSVDATWEIDVFGRVRRTIEAAGAGYQASIEDYRDVLVTLYAEVALTYTDVRAMQQRIAFTRDNAKLQSESLAIAKDRFESGIVSRLDVVQAQANLAATLATIPSLELSLNQALNRLAVLLGQHAGSLQAEFQTTGPLPDPVRSIGAGVPADVLRQRPDIRRAERLLAAQTAEIGVATADLYPSFGLSGMFGLQSRSLSNLIDSSSVTYGLGLPVQWNVFSGGRVRDNIEIQNERAQQLLLQYENKVLKAVEEVENAIIALNLGEIRLQHLQEATAATVQAVDLVQVQYDSGLTDFNNVLVTQRDLVYQQDQVVAAQAQIVTDLISLYKALGGGWDLDQAGDPPVE